MSRLCTNSRGDPSSTRVNVGENACQWLGLSYPISRTLRLDCSGHRTSTHRPSSGRIIVADQRPDCRNDEWTHLSAKLGVQRTIPLSSLLCYAIRQDQLVPSGLARGRSCACCRRQQCSVVRPDLPPARDPDRDRAGVLGSAAAESADAPQHLRGRTWSRTTPLGRRSGIPVTAVPTPRGGAMSSTPTSSPAPAPPQLSRAVATN